MRRFALPFLTCGFFLSALLGCSKGGNVLTIAFSPRNSETIYVGTTGGGFYKSRDGGATFNKTSSGLTTYNITSVAVNPSITMVVYAGSYGDSVYRSVDSGHNW
ncbi:MAG: WD40/YVTN/BNR-like repeat-containing protein, partial [Nitrospiria bacterium]